jgi:hypothetical protein
VILGALNSIIGNINPLNAELNPICHLLALLGAHPILYVSRIRLKLLLNARNVKRKSTTTFFFVIKPTRRTNFTNLFCHETLHVSNSSSVHHQGFIHCKLSNGICHTHFEQEHLLLLGSCLQTCMTYAIAECAVNKLLMMDRRTVRNM